MYIISQLYENVFAISLIFTEENISETLAFTKSYLQSKLTMYFNTSTSAMPEVRGTADVGWRSLFPLPLNPPHTHSRLYHHMCLRTDGQ